MKVRLALEAFFGITLLVLGPVAAKPVGSLPAGPPPKVDVIGRATMTRSSERQSSDGNALPPWTNVTLQNVFGFDREPSVGDKVTVVAPDGAPNLELAITRVKMRDEEDLWWEVELEPIKEKHFAEAYRPRDRYFEVVVLYPPVPGARSISPNKLSSRDLPPDVKRKEIKEAIDLDGDGRSDAILVEYCCQTSERPSGACDLHCGKTFVRNKGVWEQRSQWTPL
jgi:hypothetical protein